MVLRRLLYLAAYLPLASPHPWARPRQTHSPLSTANWSPAPTANEVKERSFLEIIRRDIYPVTVCGWILQSGKGGTTALPVTCSTRSSCAWNADVSIVGCCATASNTCKFYTGCIDADSPPQLGDKDDVYTCKGSSICYSNKYPGGYLQWGCGQSEYATSVATSYKGMNTQLSLQIAITGSDPEATISSSSGSMGSTSQSSPRSDSQSPTSDPDNPSTESPLASSETQASLGVGVGSSQGAVSSTFKTSPTALTPAPLPVPKSTSPTSLQPTASSTPESDSGTTREKRTAPIVGGSIGGVAFFALILAGIFFRRGHKRKTAADLVAEKPVADTTASPHPPQPPSPTAGVVALDSNPVFEVSGESHQVGNGNGEKSRIRDSRGGESDGDGYTVSPLMSSPLVPASIISATSPASKQRESGQWSQMPDVLRAGFQGSRNGGGECNGSAEGKKETIPELE